MASGSDGQARRGIVGPEAPRTALALSWAALLAFFARSMIDFRYVYPDQIQDTASNALAFVVYTVFLGGWILALGSLAAGHRRGAWACLGFALLPILLGLTTETVFCPTPCSTAAPVADISNWICLVLGLLSAATLVEHLRRPRGTAPESTAASGES